MKNRLFVQFAALVLALFGALSVGALAQTTEDGPGPSEQPDAPMEIGPVQDAPPAQDAQPTDAQPGGPTGEADARVEPQLP